MAGGKVKMFEDILEHNKDIVFVKCEGGCGREAEYDISVFKKFEELDIQWNIIWTCIHCHDEKVKDYDV